ncbi:unnamed protein product [Lampetra fluviatilis]
MKLVLIPVFISLLDVAFATKLQITLPQSLSVREGENVTIPCSFSPPPPDLNHIVLEWFTMPKRYAENMTRREMAKIYQSGDEMHPLCIVKSVGDVLMGDCSIRIPNFPRSLGPVALCRIDCRRCNTENTEVREEVLLNVMPAGRLSLKRAPGVVCKRRHWGDKGGRAWCWLRDCDALDLDASSRCSVRPPLCRRRDDSAPRWWEGLCRAPSGGGPSACINIATGETKAVGRGAGHPAPRYPGVYKLSCLCGSSYIGETKRHVSDRIREHKADLKHGRTNTSAVADHCYNSVGSHDIDFSKTEQQHQHHQQHHS